MTSQPSSSSLPRRLGRFNLRRRVQRRVMTLKRCIRKLWERIVMCSLSKPGNYRVLTYSRMHSLSGVVAAAAAAADDPDEMESHLGLVTPMSPELGPDSDLVALKISLLGDQHIGKTSFLAKYVGDETENSGSDIKGINLMDKTLMVRGARISYSIWEVEGDERSAAKRVPVACSDSVAILFMFDLTSRCTLNSVIIWYQQARQWNQTAIPIIVGTKFDEFVQLPTEVQWTIASQARAYAKAINATLFFSSATYNINVNKIFKFITAKLFDLPWTVERNLTPGEPMIDF